jgi:hypothetical protein
MMSSMVLGAIGAVLIVTLLGRRIGVVAATMIGAAYGLVLEALVVSLIVNQVQTVNALYTSTPGWRWWVAYGIFGGALGMLTAVPVKRRQA